MSGAAQSPGAVVMAAHLKKLKTLKKKYFVLRAEAPGHPACLEYYDRKRKYESKQPPKRSISVRSCFNINKRRDTKHKYVIALYTKDDCFCLVLDNEKELESWLNALLLLQNGDQPDGEQPRPTFEHIWQVMMQKKGLGERKNIFGPYRLCLTDRTLSLVKLGADDKSDSIEFSLSCIRRSGCMDRIFYMEVGRSAVTGGGEFWMEVEDNNIAQNMHHAINNAMTNSNSTKDEGPRQRVRSSSANEASKPISVLQRRHTAQKLHSFSPLGGPTVRDRCDSLPSRARTTSECQPNTTSSASVSTVAAAQQLSRGALLAPQVSRPLSMHSRVVSYSPPVSSMPISPASVACSTDSAGSSLSMDDTSETMEEAVISKYGHSLTPDEPVIHEENGDDYVPWPTSAAHQHKYSPNFKSCSPSQQSSYVEMYSPCSSSPGRGAYMPMSPATGIHSHSRASSLVEENSTLTDGYVPMAPMGDDGYVDMDPANNHNGHFPDDMSQHGGSSCSVTSGTPSTDLRFSEYHLDKVTSFLAPGEDLQARPTRAYSVGSRPEPARHRKNSFCNYRLDVAQQEASRVRAFSVGSRSKRPEIGRLANIVTAPLVSGMESSHSNKSSSAPLLSSSWGHNSGCSVTSDRMEDLMELDFTRPNAPGVLSSPPSSYSQSQSFSTAIDTSSYVDMSPGQPPISATAPYVDMNGPVKNRSNNNSKNNNNINNNNNNNITTANHNHNHNHSMGMVSTHKPVITQVSSLLKSVDESSYMRMSRPLDDWSQSRISPKQVPSPCQEEYMEMNGPPGGTRTAPMDLPHPRRPPEGYVEMSFKAKPSLEQDYINMTMGLGRNCRKHHSSNNRKKKCSMPIAIQAGSKPNKTPNFLPLNGSPSSESLASTPASPPRATPTGSSATIFPFSLNSPQSPIKPFTATQANDKPSSIATASSVKTEVINAPLITRKMSAPSPLPGVDGCPSSKKAHDNPISSTSNFDVMYKHNRPVPKEQDMEVEIEKQESKMDVDKEKKKAKSQEKEHEKEREKYRDDEEKMKGKEKQKLKEKEREEEKECSRAVYNSSSSQKPTVTSLSPITKKLSDLSVSKPRLVTASPMVSPTPMGFKPVQIPKPASPKVGDDATPTPTPTPTPTSTPTPTPSPLDSEGYEKLQPGDPAIHYASLDLPEVAPPPPQSPVSDKDGFTYAEIDFAKLK